MRLDDLIAQADGIIEKRAAKQEAPVEVPMDEETVKLASFLESFEGDKKVEPQAESPFQMTFVEKLASSMAIVEALNNYEEFQKIASFREKAIESGYTEAQVEEFLEKKAMKVPSAIAVPALAGIAAGVAGHMHGRKKGYDKAIADVNQAFEQAQSRHE